MASNLTMLCPAPLVSVPFGSSTDGTVIYVDADISDCAIPCPQLIYSEDEWESMKDAMFAGSLVSVIAALFVLITHFSNIRRHFLRLMFISGFFLNSVVVLAFSARNHSKNEVVCGGDGAEFLQKTPLCVFQGAATIWAFTWIEYWSVVLSFDSYMMVSHRATSFRAVGEDNEKKRNWYYMFGALAVCSIFTSIPLGAGNFGFDPMQNVPMCLFLFSTSSYYFWSCFIVPLTIMVSLCCFFSVLGMIQMHSIFVNSNHRYKRRGEGGKGSVSSTGLSSTGGGRGGARGRFRSDTSMLTDDYDDENFTGVRDSINPLSEQSEEEDTQASDAVYTQATANTAYTANTTTTANTANTAYTGTNTTVTDPLLSSSYMSGSRGSEATSMNSELNNLLGGNLTLDADERRGLGEAVADEGDEYIHTPNTRPPHLRNNYDPYPYGRSSNSNSNSDVLVDGEGFVRIQRNISEATAVSPKRSSSPSRTIRGSDSTGPRFSILSATSIYRSVASFWTRSGEKHARKGGPSWYGDEDENVDEDEDDEDENAQEGGGYSGLTSSQLALYNNANGDDRASERENSKETISLGTGTGPNQSRDDSGIGYDANYTNTRKQDAANARVSMLRSIVKSEAIRQTLRYNGRGLLFVFVYCLSTLYIVPVLYVLQAVTYSTCQDSATDFAGCLLGASYASIEMGVPQTQADVDAFAKQQCGQFPEERPDAGLVYSGLIWLSGYGIIPAIIFGVGSSFADTVASWTCCEYWLRKPSASDSSSFSADGRGFQGYSD